MFLIQVYCLAPGSVTQPIQKNSETLEQRSELKCLCQMLVTHSRLSWATGCDVAWNHTYAAVSVSWKTLSHCNALITGNFVFNIRMI